MEANEEITHEPVLLDEVLAILKEHLDETGSPRILDGTLGLGGYSEAMLNAFPQAFVLGTDRDTEALERSEARLVRYTSGTSPRFAAKRANFGDIEDTAKTDGPFDALVFDFGVSNLQLADAKRGFSFMHDGPLDMRMDPHGDDPTAAELLAAADVDELTRIFRDYGGERYARQIAVRVEANRRRGEKLETTGDLVAMIRDLLPAPVQRKMGAHPARRVFQALRIAVNNEMGEIESLFASMPRAAAPGAVAVVVSYHSLEDRIAKHSFRDWEKEKGLGHVLTRHPVLPSEAETERNYKSRSAKLRAFQFKL